MAFKPNSNWQLWFSAQCFLSSQIICRLWVCRLAKYSGNFSMMDYPMLSHILKSERSPSWLKEYVVILGNALIGFLWDPTLICSIWPGYVAYWTLCWMFGNRCFQLSISCFKVTYFARTKTQTQGTPCCFSLCLERTVIIYMTARVHIEEKL